MKTATKTKTVQCRNPECARVAVQKGFCKPCIASGKVAQIIRRQQYLKDRDRRGFEGMVRLRTDQHEALIDACNEKMEATGLTFNALAIKALARYLRITDVVIPERGQPRKEEVEF